MATPGTPARRRAPQGGASQALLDDGVPPPAPEPSYVTLYVASVFSWALPLTALGLLIFAVQTSCEPGAQACTGIIVIERSLKDRVLTPWFWVVMSQYALLAAHDIRVVVASGEAVLQDIKARKRRLRQVQSELELGEEGADHDGGDPEGGGGAPSPLKAALDREIRRLKAERPRTRVQMAYHCGKRFLARIFPLAAAILFAPFEQAAVIHLVFFFAAAPPLLELLELGVPRAVKAQPWWQAQVLRHHVELDGGGGSPLMDVLHG